MLLWATLIGLLFGASQIWMIPEEFLRSQRARFHRHPASGEIVLIGIDNKSLQEFGRYPWPSSRLAELVTRLDRAGARKIFVTDMLTAKSDDDGDSILTEAFRNTREKVVLSVAFGIDAVEHSEVDLRPLPQFEQTAELATVNAPIVFPFGTVRRVPFELKIGGKSYPSFSALLGERRGQGDFRLDYSTDPKTMPVVSASDILNGKTPTSSLKGKNVIVGPTFHPYQDEFFEPVYGDFPGTYLHIFGAETLRQGKPYTLSWIWPLLTVFLICLASLVARRRLLSITSITAGFVAVLVLPLTLELNLIFTDVMPAVFLLTYVSCGLLWNSYREQYRAKGLTNEVSGLPNLNALNQHSVDPGHALVVARIHNYAAIVATLTSPGEKALVEQVAKRLMVGTPDPRLYQGDEGIFAWFAERQAGASTGAHLDALHSLFRSPVIAEGRQFDLVITFGFDAANDRLIANRLASVLVAADEAHKAGLKWKEHDPSRVEASSWKLSLLSQLDAAIDAGDVWIAYQPKLDLTTNQIVGAEALARWTHSEKGPINPLEFILAAEQSNRIEKLTHYVMEHAIRAAAAINRHGRTFGVSVNISARLLEDPNLVGTVRKLLTKHALNPEYLTLEVTETAAIGNAARSLATLRQLRDMGLCLSVDDYGTGMSTLDYLQRIPASEIKIDRSFVIGMNANHATRVMVNSTIQLAHSLGQKVVAEGVEDEETLDELRRMGCDIAQGYLIGKPMAFRALSKTLALGRKEDAA